MIPIDNQAFKENLQEEIFRSLENRLIPYGFKHSIELVNALEKQYNFGKDYVFQSHMILLYSFNQMRKQLFSLSRTVDIIENLWIDLSPFGINTKKCSFLFWDEFAYPEITNEGFFKKGDNSMSAIHCTIDKNGIEKFNEISFFVIKEKILPLAKYYMDLKHVDNFINNHLEIDGKIISFLGGDGAVFRRLIIARLCDNKLFDDIYLFHMQLSSNYIKSLDKEPDNFTINYISAFEKLYNRLKQVKPLSNSILS